MDEAQDAGRVRFRTAEDGVATYVVALGPEALPAVRRRDLEQAWQVARRAAIRAEAGRAVRFRFHRPEGAVTELTLADRDACCWASAVDAAIGLGTSYGISLCLRLLALVDLLARSRWADRLIRLERDGAELHPMLLQAAATLKLDDAARLDPLEVKLGCAAILPTALTPPELAPWRHGAFE